MAKRRVLLLSIVVAVLASAAVLIPASPLSLANLLGPRYEGRSRRYWISALKSPDIEVRHKAIAALGELGPDVSEAVPLLAAILRDDTDTETRKRAVLALSKMAPASRAAVDDLGLALGDDNLEIRMNAAVALLRLAEEARPAIPALIKALQDESNQTPLGDSTTTIWEVMVAALGRASAGSDEGVAALSAALEDAATVPMRVATIKALGDVGSEAHLAGPLLQKMTRDENPAVRKSAMESLLLIGDGSTTFITPSKSSVKVVTPEEHLDLPASETSYIWQIENHGNQLVKYGFGPLAQAIREANEKKIKALLADSFHGSALADPRAIQSNSDSVQVERLEDSGKEPAKLNRDGFVARLMQFRKVFPDKPPQVKFALMTLSPKRRKQFDGPWEANTQMRLHGESSEGAPAEVVAYIRFELARPNQETLTKPGWLLGASITQVLTARSPRYLFADVAKERGLNVSKLHDNWTSSPMVTTTGGIYVCDFNRDGILDILVTDLVKGTTLYQGTPTGAFKDVTALCGLPEGPPSTIAAAWIDIDGDGWDDLILGNRVFRNEQGKRFVDQTDRCNLKLPPTISNLAVADYDRDGKLDIYATRSAKPGDRSWLEGKGAALNGNYLFRNKGNWQFEDVTRKSGTEGGRRSTFTAAWLDANNDGWPDLHVINEFGDGVLLINNGNGTFSPRKLANYPADFGTMGVAVGDIDNDGNIDIYCANMYSKAGMRVTGNLAPDAYPPKVMEKLRRFRCRQPTAPQQGGAQIRAGGDEDAGCRGWLGVRALSGRPRQRRLARHLCDGWLHKPRSQRTGWLKLRLVGCRVTALRPQCFGSSAWEGGQVAG